MSSEDTAKHFKDQSEEQILTWMLSNLTPEQIKDCLPDEKPELSQEKELTTEDKIRDYCSGKKYVIHKVENDIVYFWYLLGKSWKYYNRPLSDFPTEKGKDAEECGNNSDDDAPSSPFNTDLLSVPNSSEFSETLKAYKDTIDISWIKLKTEDNLSLGEDVNKLTKLREYCSGKKYVIHKIENDTVFFWFFEKGKWKYYNNGNLSDFPKSLGENSDECGDDTTIQPSSIKNAYTNNELYDEELIDTFIDVKKEYEKLQINNLWIDPLIKSIVIQRLIELKGDLKLIFNFVPILIESVTASHVNYYYIDEYGVFTEKQIEISELNNELEKYVEQLKLNTTYKISPTNTIDDIHELIKTNFEELFMDEDYLGDLNRIKEIYSQFPLSADSPFFIKNLIKKSNEFGSCKEPHSYGTSFTEKYNSKLKTNQFGATTTIYSEKGFFG